MREEEISKLLRWGCMMKKNKRALITLGIIVIVLLCLGWFLNERYSIFTIGGKQPQYHYTVGKFTKEDLGFFDTKTGETISLGMSKDEVEQLFGKGEDKDRFVEYADQLEVFYREDKVAGLRMWKNDDEKMRFVTARNIGPVYSFEDVKSVYGAPSTVAQDNLGYIFEEAEGSTYKIHPDIRKMTKENKERSYFVEFMSRDGKSDIVIMNLKYFN